MSNPALARAVILIDAVGAELADAPFAHQTQSRQLERIPLPDEAEADRRSALARQWRHDIAAIDRTALPAPVARGVALAEATADRLAQEAPWYWHVHDPLGLGFFGLFGPTAYCGGWYLGVLGSLLGRHRFDGPNDFERYLDLVADIAALIRAMRDRLAGQARRGIVMPVAQIPQSQALIGALRLRTPSQLLPAVERYGHLPGADRFGERVRAMVDTEIGNAFDALTGFLAGDYAARAPDRVGIGQYDGGADIYAGLVRHHTTLDLDPAQVHAIGAARVADIRAAMAELRGAVGFDGDDAAYRGAIAADPAWQGRDTGHVAAHFRRKLTAVEPWLDRWLRIRPAARHDVAPLPEALAASMTFGYYQVPANAADTGRYLFNAANLTQSGLATVAALTFHELVPGHHVHLASQAENRTLPALARHNSFNAFNEGWAEYAATLAGEHGLYATPEERFGRMMMDAMLTSRLVVDTGMNALGWSLERAQGYMRENAFLGEHEIVSESIRYACDLPGQALAYKLGDTFLIEQRERMRTALGPAFDLRDFHDAVLANGALPLPLVTGEIDRTIARLAGSVPA